MASEAEWLSGLPSQLRERVELVEEALEEAPHPFVYRLLVEEGTRQVIEEYKAKKEVLKVRKCLADDIKGILGTKRVDEGLVEGLERAFGSGEIRAVGVDAGVNYLNLEVAYVPLCCAVAALCSRFDVLDFMPKAMERIPLWDDEVYPEWRTLVVSYRLQFELVKEAVEAWEPDVVFFDGPFLYSQLMRGERGTPYWVDFERAIEEGVRALHFCAEKDVPIISFVKRPEGVSVARKMLEAGVLKRPTRDTVVLKWMEHGTYLEPFRYVARGGALGRREVPSRMAEEYFKKAREAGIDEDEVTIYFTYVSTGYAFPYKVEVPGPFLDRMDELMALTLALRASRGIPLPIYVADSLTKMTNTTRDLFLLSLRARLAEEVEAGRLDEGDLEMFLPRHGEVYGLTESDLEGKARGSRRRRP